MKKRNKLILKALSVALMGATITSASAQQIIVNEFLRAGNLTTTDEYIELVLMQDLTAAQLEGFFVGDSTSSTAAKFSGYKFTNMATIAPTFCAGSIITVGGDTSPTADTLYNPANGDWAITLHTSGTNLTGNGSNGDLAAGDVAYIDTDGTNGNNTISANGFAVAWDSAPGTFANNASLLLTNRPNNNTGAYLNDILANAALDASWVSDATATLTPGAVNGGANTTSIQALQATALGTVTISGTPSLNEGNAGTTAYTFTVTRTASCAAASVDFAITGTGANPADAADFGGALPTGTVNFAAGATTASITVNVTGDTVIETDETFLVTLSNPVGVALGATVTDTGTIVNDDVASISINDIAINEGNAGTTTLDFTVTISSSATASVQVDTADVTATAGTDYVAIAAQTVNFSAGGATTQTVSVTINGDTVIETDETFNVNLTNAVGATIADAQGVGTITNDDSVQAILSAIKSVSGDLQAGGMATYTIDISNTGPNPQNDNPGDEMTDTLPASLTFVSASATSGVVNNVGNTVTWNGSVAAGATETVTIVAQINASAAGTIENTATVSYDNDGDNINESTAVSASPTAAGPTAFFIPFMVPSLNHFALLLLMLTLLSVVYIKTKQRS